MKYLLDSNILRAYAKLLRLQPQLWHCIKLADTHCGTYDEPCANAKDAVDTFENVMHAATRYLKARKRLKELT